MVHRACKLARACVPAVEPVAFTTDVRADRTSVALVLCTGLLTTLAERWKTPHRRGLESPAEVRASITQPLTRLALVPFTGSLRPYSRHLCDW